MVFGIVTGLLRRGRASVRGNFTSKRGPNDFYKGKGVSKYGRLGTGRLASAPLHRDTCGVAARLDAGSRRVCRRSIRPK